MDSPFNFEGKYHKGKNEPDNKEEISESTDLVALVEAAEKKLNNPELFSEDNLIVKHKKDIYENLVKRLEKEDLSQLDNHKDFAVRQWVKELITSEGASMFYTENELDRQDETPSVLDEGPYKSVPDLIDGLSEGFRETFWSEIDMLNFLPGSVFLTFEDEIQSADFEILVYKEDTSSKFKDTFSNSNIFYIGYDRYSEKPHDRAFISGVKDNGDFEDTVELEGLGGLAI